MPILNAIVGRLRRLTCGGPVKREPVKEEADDLSSIASLKQERAGDDCGHPAPPDAKRRRVDTAPRSALARAPTACKGEVAAPPMTAVPGGKNLVWGVRGTELHLRIPDLSLNFGPSSTGKTVVVSSSCGNKQVLATRIVLSVNAYLTPGTHFRPEGLATFKPWYTDNVDMALEGAALHVRIDLSAAGYPSSSGKVKILASTCGNRMLGGSNVLFTCNAMVSSSERADLSGSFTPHFFPEVDHPGSFQALTSVLDEAREALDVALYMLTNHELAQLLVRKHREGVKVRVICDDEQERDAPADMASLGAAGIPVRSDRSRLRMHHKFAVVDSVTIVSGSLNWTAAAVKHNQENVVISRSAELAGAFQLEFERLWTAFGRCGKGQGPGGDCDSGLASTGAFVNGSAALFFPDRDDENYKILLSELRSATRSLHVCVFALTLNEVIDAMGELVRKGVDVRVLSDDACSKFHGGEHTRAIRHAGVAFRTDNSHFNMHHKFCVIDGHTVVNGSFNWTKQAKDGNQENLVIYRNAPELARQFTCEFSRLWAKFG